MMSVAVAAPLALLAVAALAVLLWAQQERIVFQPPGPPLPAAGDTRRLDFDTDDGERLFGYVVGDTVSPAGVLIAFHGNADLAVWQIPWAREVARRTGWVVFLAEYRGYGGATGKPTYAGSRRDASAANRAAAEFLGATPERTALFGHSLGSAIATELAVEIGPRALILQSPFSSAREMARIIVARPLDRLWALVSRVHFDTEARVATLDTPVWVAHGTRDFIIPVRMGREVHAAARIPGELLLVAGAGHNDLPDIAGESYWEWIERALR
ncbi:MAG TPA: alpha/beta hydrolase [Gemmatimonadaceae bacterium]|nr:alpha/beta hydrolase [Gemmatimonadaceae bacterium]